MEQPARLSPGSGPGPGAARSCIHCAKAKAKCLRLAGESACYRCHRLKKECSAREPVQRKRRSAKSTRAAQLESLENKLENLVNVLSSSKQSGSNEYKQPSPISQISISQPSTNQTSSSTATVAGDLSGKQIAERMSKLDYNFNNTATSFLPGVDKPVHAQHWDVGVTETQAEVLLDRFRTHMAPGYPFVVIPDDLRAVDLFVQKPFLCKVVITVACYQDLTTQRRLVKEALKELANRSLLNNEKSLDLLQGLLVFATWYHPHIFVTPQYSNILQMAQALVNDLGLNKPPQAWDKSKVQGIGYRVQPGLLPTSKPTLDEHRALAGLFFTTSVNSASFKKQDAIKYTQTIDDGLAALQEANEYESDKLLVDMLKVQRFCETTHTTELSPGSGSSASTFYLKALLADLQRIKSSMNPKSWENKLIRMQYANAEIHAYELAMSDGGEETASSEAAFRRLEILFGCLQATKSVFQEHLAIPPMEYLNLTFQVFGYFSHAMIILSKICALEIDGWDPQNMHGGLNFGQTIEEAAVRLEQATTLVIDGQQISNDWTASWARMLRWLKGAYGANSGPQTYPDTPAESSSIAKQPEVPVAQQPTPPDDPLSGEFFNYLDDSFWKDFMSDFDFGYLDVPMQ